MSVLFLDIDGVLNRYALGAPLFQPECVKELNRILITTKCSVVLSSSWRSLLFPCRETGQPADMTLSGFAYMLRTHGIYGLQLIGCTPDDDGTFATVARGKEVQRYVIENKPQGPLCALDDDPSGFSACSVPLVQTNDELGLTSADADRVIEILEGPKS